ncbi:DUF2291 domain-containing protein [Mucilaginibacter robiniae]|uniref:DUF2291 domain-containing protein n=1 Tax=Mucilaginibacter robiniae TaxID=2728022 RepID=A0A7L5E4F6_9SPHI|nr:DUF2291 domain-containing protein [Mucilaginibacter robiniae]QJD97921.1 DUF2291 domain-containing protein [Mucilaginibacter robiniae]
MKKAVKYIVWLVIIAFVVYNSVYFRKLSEVKAAGKSFDAASYAHNYLNKVLPSAMTKATAVDNLFMQLHSAPAQAFQQHSHALAIGSTRFFLVKGTGQINNIDENSIGIVTDTGKLALKIATEYVYGNAVRDASGLVDINAFTNTADLNNVSAEINKSIRQQVIPSFKAQAKKGDHVQFTGALELNQAHLNLDDAEIIPVTIKRIP